MPKKFFLPFSPRIGHGCYLMAPTGRGSQTLLTRPARGEWWYAVTDPCSLCRVTPQEGSAPRAGGDIDVK